MGVKMNLRIITKNHEADSEIEFLIKSITKSFDRAMAMPLALELNNFLEKVLPPKRSRMSPTSASCCV